VRLDRSTFAGRVDFSTAQLTSVQLNSSEFAGGACFDSAKMNSVNFSSAKFEAPVSFVGASFHGGDLGATFPSRDALLKCKELHCISNVANLHFADASLRSCTLTTCELENCEFDGGSISECVLRDCRVPSGIQVGGKCEFVGGSVGVALSEVRLVLSSTCELTFDNVEMSRRQIFFFINYEANVTFRRCRMNRALVLAQSNGTISCTGCQLSWAVLPAAANVDADCTTTNMRRAGVNARV